MRYLPLSADDRAAMLAAIGVRDIDELFKDVPQAARLEGLVDLQRGVGEIEVERMLTRMAAKNVAAGSVPFFIGAGAYRHHIPASVDHLIQRSEFLTSYTPYQPEISQGTLQYLFEFQTQVALLTGMEVANASLYDGSTGCGEAVTMANRVTRRKKAVLSGNLHPQYREVVKTLAGVDGFTVAVSADRIAGFDRLLSLIDDDTSCAVVQYPNFFGTVEDLTAVAEAARAKGALLVVVVPEVVSLGLLRAPGSFGADIVVGEGQSLGVGLNFGGPYLGLFATREKYLRQMPGRVCGMTVDADGRRGFVLTLSTREQHIRREKATSNICTNSGLCCLAFTIHLTLLGEAGLTRLARLNRDTAKKLARALGAVDGVEVVTPLFFNEITVKLPKPAKDVVHALAARGVLGGVAASRLVPDDESIENLLVAAATETNTDDDIAAYAAALREVLR